MIFRSALQQLEARGASSVRAVLKKKPFLKKYGEEMVPVSTIPYASTFGVSGDAMSLRDVANLNFSTSSTSSVSDRKVLDVERNGESTIIDRQTREAPSSSASVPLYAFNIASPRWRRAIEDDIGLPELIEVRRDSKTVL